MFIFEKVSYEESRKQRPELNKFVTAGIELNEEEVWRWRD
jgi:hypothetical protein